MVLAALVVVCTRTSRSSSGCLSGWFLIAALRKAPACMWAPFLQDPGRGRLKVSAGEGLGKFTQRIMWFALDFTRNTLFAGQSAGLLYSRSEPAGPHRNIGGAEESERLRLMATASAASRSTPSSAAAASLGFPPRVYLKDTVPSPHSVKCARVATHTAHTHARAHTKWASANAQRKGMSAMGAVKCT